MFVISLFGPRNGRLLQAKFDNSGTLKVLASDIYSFERKTEALDLFLRYFNSTPRDGQVKPDVVKSKTSIRCESELSLN